MYRQFPAFLISTALCICGGCTANHPPALKLQYDQLSLGQCIPAQWKQPQNAKTSVSGELHGIYLDRNEGDEFGAFEAIVYVLDDRQRVVAKRYSVNRKDMSWGIVTILNRAECAVSAPDAKTTTAIQEMCNRLDSLHLQDSTGLAYDDTQSDKQLQGDLATDLVCQGAQKAGWKLADRKGYRRDNSWTEGRLGSFRQKLNWSVNVIRPGEINVVCEHRADISVVAMTVEGYAYIIATGKLPY